MPQRRWQSVADVPALPTQRIVAALAFRTVCDVCGYGVVYIIFFVV